MPSTWAANDWLSTDAVTHTRLNNLGNSIRTIGYGETAGTVIINGNQNAINNLGAIGFAAGGSITQDTWNNAVLQNGWFTLGSHQNLAYRLDKQGNLLLRGSISGGTHTSGTLIFTLPVGFRPASARTFPCTNDGGTCSLTVLTDGTVKIYNAVGNSAVHVYTSIPT